MKKLFKKPLSVKNMTIIYGIILIVSLSLVIVLTSIFVTSKIKNQKLVNEYNQAQDNYAIITEQDELRKDENYEEAKTKDSNDDKEPKIYVKQI